MNTNRFNVKTEEFGVVSDNNMAVFLGLWREKQSKQNHINPLVNPANYKNTTKIV